MSKNPCLFHSVFRNLNQPKKDGRPRNKKNLSTVALKIISFTFFLMNVKDVNENYIEKTLFTRLRRFLEFLKYQNSVS